LQRLLTSATLVALLVATAAAFAITERLKLTKSPIYRTAVSTTFSPKCGCARRSANVRVFLRRADTLDVEIDDAHGHELALLAGGAPYRRGEAKFRWNGRTDGGLLARDGVYRVRIHLARQHQTIILPNRIRLDTTPPKVVDVQQNRDAFSPDGDKQADYVRFTYVLSKPARVLLYLGGRRVLKTHFYPQRGKVSFYGLARGRLLRPGHYTLEVGALDLAGNITPPDERLRVHVKLRYIVLASRHIVARAGKRFEIGVSTDAVRYHWSLGKRKGRNGGGVLRLRAPDKPGRYMLTVRERGHVDRAHVVVK
jgi:FlgD Ig-like domain